jgi:speckle targeted PIP5K1A-regulated poly(A) polymerase
VFVRVFVRLALRNTELIRYYVTCDKRIRHLVYVVRCWAKMAGVSGSKGSKLTNYALTLLVIFYLQNLKPSGLPSVDELSRLAGKEY